MEPIAPGDARLRALAAFAEWSGDRSLRGRLQELLETAVKSGSCATAIHIVSGIGVSKEILARWEDFLAGYLTAAYITKDHVSEI